MEINLAVFITVIPGLIQTANTKFIVLAKSIKIQVFCQEGLEIKFKWFCQCYEFHQQLLDIEI